jgi:hypothetical protein
VYTRPVGGLGSRNSLIKLLSNSFNHGLMMVDDGLIMVNDGLIMV